MTDAAPDAVVAALIERLIIHGSFGSWITPDALPGWIFTGCGSSRGWFGATPVAIRLPRSPRSATLPAS